jgi:hypothetical protein
MTKSNQQTHPARSCKQNIITTTPFSFTSTITFNDRWPAVAALTSYFPVSYISYLYLMKIGSHRSWIYFNYEPYVAQYCGITRASTTCFLPTCRSLNPGTVTNCDESLRIVTNVTAELMVSAEMMVTHSISAPPDEWPLRSAPFFSTLASWSIAWLIRHVEKEVGYGKWGQVGDMGITAGSSGCHTVGEMSMIVPCPNANLLLLY